MSSCHFGEVFPFFHCVISLTGGASVINRGDRRWESSQFDFEEDLANARKNNPNRKT